MRTFEEESKHNKRTGSNSSSSCYYLKSKSSITIVRWISSTSASVNSLSCSRQNSIKMWELAIYNHSLAWTPVDHSPSVWQKVSTWNHNNHHQSRYALCTVGHPEYRTWHNPDYRGKACILHIRIFLQNPLTDKRGCDNWNHTPFLVESVSVSRSFRDSVQRLMHSSYPFLGIFL